MKQSVDEWPTSRTSSYIAAIRHRLMTLSDSETLLSDSNNTQPLLSNSVSDSLLGSNQLQPCLPPSLSRSLSETVRSPTMQSVDPGFDATVRGNNAATRKTYASYHAITIFTVQEYVEPRRLAGR